MKQKTNRKVIVIGLVILAMISIVGVAIYFIMNGVSFTSDVTQNQRLWGEYQYQKDYVLERDVFLQAGYFMIENDGTVKPETKPLLLVPESSYKGRGLGRHNTSPNTISEYESDPEKSVITDYEYFKSKINVVGIVRKGTKLRPVKLTKVSGFHIMAGWGEVLTPYVEILDGEHKGKIVDITDISIYYKNDGDSVFLYKPEKGVIVLANASN